MEEITIKVDGKEYNVTVEETSEGKLRIQCDGDIYEVESKENILKNIEESIEKRESSKEGKSVIVAPLPGIVFSINVRQGDKVKKGTRLLTLIAMKMENEISSQKEGIVKEIKVKKNDSVDKDDVLMIIE